MKISLPPYLSRLRSVLAGGLGLVCMVFALASCGTATTATLTDRAVPAAPAPTQPPAPTVAPVEAQPAPVESVETTDEAPADAEPVDAGDSTNGNAETDDGEPATDRIRSFQEFLPDPAAVEERYGDSGLWALVEIRYLEPGERVGMPCGETEPPNFDGIEAIYSNVSGENLLVMVQRGEGVDIWIPGVAEGVECTELGIRQSAITVPGTDQSVVLEMNPEAPAASMAVTGALQGDIFISFVAGAVNAESPVADPNPLVDMTVAMFERINAAS